METYQSGNNVEALEHTISDQMYGLDVLVQMEDAELMEFTSAARLFIRFFA